MMSTAGSYWTTIYQEFGSMIERIGIERQFGKDELVFREKDPYEGFFEIVSGNFKVYILNADGKEAIFKIASAGELIATPPIFQTEEPCLYPAFCQALTEGELIFYPKKQFLDFLLGNPKALYLFSVLTVDHVNYFRKKMVENLFLTVKEKILGFLKGLGAETNFVHLPIAKQQLASLLGTTPESVSRAFRFLLDEGIVEENGDRYRIL